MKKTEKIATIGRAKASCSVCRMFFKYDADSFYYLPVGCNEKFFYGVEEDDFITDGFSIRKISDLKKIEIQNGKCSEFLAKEGTFTNINAPKINLDSWKTVFESLQKSEKYIIVEKESLDEKESRFIIGKIIKINKMSVEMRDFDVDGEWYETIFPFKEITSVNFQSRYVSVWAKYFD